jgi:uncharacterized protein YaaN involved in tellurite resistance
MILQLRDWLGKSEDAIHPASIRRSHLAGESENIAVGGLVPEQIQAEIVSDFRHSFNDARSLELVNKTNQFNLNGKRYTDMEWRRFLTTPGSFLMTAS